jgi:hypothetical protein
VPYTIKHESPKARQWRGFGLSKVGILLSARITPKASVPAFDFRKPFILGRMILPCAEPGMLRGMDEGLKRA